MLYNFAIIFIGAFTTASISYFIDTCMDNGMIFRGYYKWLVKFHAKKTDLDAAMFHSDNDDMLYELAAKSFWFKPMGGCIICMNVWICFFTLPVVYLIAGLNFTLWDIFIFFGYVSLSNYFLRKLML